MLGKAPQLAKRSTAPRDVSAPLVIEAGAVIGTQAIVFAGAQIGAGTIIGDQAFVRERATIGPDTVVGRASGVDNDVTIGARVRIQSQAYVTAYSVIEDDVFFGPCAMTTNDDTMARHPKGMPLRGATLRRACRIGGGAVLVPGVEIGEEAFVAAGAVVTADVPARKVVMGVPGAARARRARRGPARALGLSRGRGRATRGGEPLALHPDDLLAARADADEHDRHLDRVGDEVQVVARGLRQVGRRAALGDVLAPAVELDVLAAGVVQDRLVVGEVGEVRAVEAAVGRADLDLVEAGEHVELRDRQRRQAVDARGVAQRGDVQPAGAPRAAGRRAELAAAACGSPRRPRRRARSETGPEPTRVT